MKLSKKDVFTPVKFKWFNSNINVFWGLEEMANRDMDFDVYLPTLGMNLQRDLVWTLLQKQQFIISIIKGIPVNKCAIVEIKKDDDNTKSNTYQVIDGKQRLTTVISFYRGEFPLTINGIDYYYSDLAIDCLSELRSFSPRCDIAYSYDNCPVTDKMKVLWFEQLNFSGTPQDEAHLLKLKAHHPNNRTWLR